MSMGSVNVGDAVAAAAHGRDVISGGRLAVALLVRAYAAVRVTRKVATVMAVLMAAGMTVLPLVLRVKEGLLPFGNSVTGYLIFWTLAFIRFSGFAMIWCMCLNAALDYVVRDSAMRDLGSITRVTPKPSGRIDDSNTPPSNVSSRGFKRTRSLTTSPELPLIDMHSRCTVQSLLHVRVVLDNFGRRHADRLQAYLTVFVVTSMATAAWQTAVVLEHHAVRWPLFAALAAAVPTLLALLVCQLSGAAVNMSRHMHYTQLLQHRLTLKECPRTAYTQRIDEMLAVGSEVINNSENLKVVGIDATMSFFKATCSALFTVAVTGFGALARRGYTPLLPDMLKVGNAGNAAVSQA